MGFQDSLSYLYKNPLVTGTADCVKYAVGYVVPSANRSTSAAVPKIAECTAPIWRHMYPGSGFVRLAGVFGATAVALGAYGAHNIFNKEGNDEQKRVFETANRYHFLHTIALLGVPLCRWPRTTGTLLTLGMVLFSGTCYYYALTGSKQFSRFTPVGGSLLIVGWLAMIL